MADQRQKPDENPPPKLAANFTTVSMPHPLIHSLSDINVSLGSEFEERMAALQQVYLQQRQTLMFQFNQSQAQLAIQHFHYMQQLIHEYNVQKQLQEQKDAAAAEQQAIEANNAFSHHSSAEVARKISMPTSQSLYAMSTGPSELLTTTSSGTISNKTKERLVSFINKRMNRQQLQSVGCSPDDQCLSDDYQLRKASSEPNLKMRTALRNKLQHRSSPKSPQQLYGKTSHYTVGPYPQPVGSGGIFRHSHSGSVLREHSERYNSEDVLMDIANSGKIHTDGLANAAVSIQRMKSFDRSGSTSPTPAPQTATGNSSHQGHQIFKPQPLYSSPSLPDMSSANVMRQMQKSLSMAAAAQAMERSSNTASLLSHAPAIPTTDMLTQLSSLAALNPDSALLRSLSGIMPVQIAGAGRGTGTVPMAAAIPGLSSLVNPAAYYGAAGLAGLDQSSAAFRPMDKKGDQPSVQFNPLMLSAASSRVDPSSNVISSNNQSVGVPSSSTLKDQLRNLIIRRKSIVREEPEEEVQMDAGPSLPTSESASNSSPELLGRSMSMSSCSSYKASSGDNLTLNRKHHLPTESRKRVVIEDDAAALQLRPPKVAETIDITYDISGTTATATTMADCEKPSGSAPTTGIAYDTLMCKHQCLCNDNKRHLEHSGRIQSIWARLQETGLINRCERLQARKAGIDCLKLVHTDIYANFFGTTATCRAKLSLAELPVKCFTRLSCGGVGVDTDTYFNDNSTSVAARMAVGCTVELCVAIMEGRIRNGFAIVRPPGSHAEPQQALGFCYFNNVAIAAKYLLQQQFVDSENSLTMHENGRSGYRLQRILILDWDVHHGNGTQLVFYDNPNVLYVSIHRHDGGSFFPGSGSIVETGDGAGLGFNVNIAFNGGPMGDTEYLAAWRCIIDPILTQFNPDFILVSSGFDATSGHPLSLGGYQVTPAFFGYATQQLCKYANGRIAMVLEGGYDLASVCDCAAECIRVLCGEEPSPFAEANLVGMPNKDAVETIGAVINTHSKIWKRLQPELLLVSHRDFDAATQARNKFAALSVAGRQERPTVEIASSQLETKVSNVAVSEFQSGTVKYPSSTVAAATVAASNPVSVIKADNLIRRPEQNDNFMSPRTVEQDSAAVAGSTSEEMDQS